MPWARRRSARLRWARTIFRACARARGRRDPQESDPLSCPRPCRCRIFDLDEHLLYTPPPGFEALLAPRGLTVRKGGGDRGRGLFATRPFSANETVCEFAGAALVNFRCYHPYLLATAGVSIVPHACEACSYMNHAPSGPSCNVKLLKRPTGPPLAVTTRDVAAGEEFCFDYSDARTPAAIFFKGSHAKKMELKGQLAAATVLRGVSTSDFSYLIAGLPKAA